MSSQPVSPTRVIPPYVPGDDSGLADHLADIDNPHNVTYTQVGADVAGTAAALIAAHEAEADPHSQYTTEAEVDALIAAAGVVGAIGDLTDVTISTLVTGDYLRYSGTAWVDVTAAQLLTDLLTIDGTGSGLDADLLDGQHASAFQAASANLTTIAGISALSANYIRGNGSDWVGVGITQLLTDLKTVDGASSGLDADLLDGQHASSFSLTSHTHSLDNLSDVVITTPLNGQVLKYNGAEWINDTDATGGGSGALDDLTDVTITAAATGDYLRYSGTAWVDVTVGQILTDLLTVDGTGSGLDADLLDGNHASAFSLTSHTHTVDNLSDATITTPSNGEVLTYQAGIWVNQAAGGPGGTTFDAWDVRRPPASPHAMDDEFNDASLDAKWTEWDPVTILTVTEQNYGVVLTHANLGGSHSFAGIYQALGADDEYQFVAKCMVQATITGGGIYSYAGIALTEDVGANPTTADFSAFLLRESFNSPQIEFNTWSAYNANASAPFSAAMYHGGKGWICVQYKASTNRVTAFWSPDGENWSMIVNNQAPRGTPTHVALVVNSFGLASVQVFRHFRVTSGASGIYGVRPPPQGGLVTITQA